MWCPINPRSVARENRELLDLFGCSALIFQGAHAGVVAEIEGDVPGLTTLVCLDVDVAGATAFQEWISAATDEPPGEATLATSWRSSAPAGRRAGPRRSCSPTGDTGYLGDEGHLFIVDRAEDTVIIGGFNVYPAEVAVVGLPPTTTGASESSPSCNSASVSAGPGGVKDVRAGRVPVGPAAVDRRQGPQGRRAKPPGARGSASWWRSLR